MQESPSVHRNNRLRLERIRRNWRQQEVADRLGATVASVKRWERGSHRPSLYFREKLCTLFEKSAEELGLVDALAKPATPPARDESVEEPTHSSSEDLPALWTVPYRRNLYFTGRDELLNLLDQHLSGDRAGVVTTTHRAALTQPQAIKGLGGIGKTQIAVEYAYRAHERKQYTHTLWINAASKEALMTSFTALAHVLPAFPAKNETDQQKLVEAIKHWLKHCQQRWLLIFDNADDLSLIREYLPPSGSGSILLTTRASAVGSLAAAIEVERMGFIEGTHLLLRRAQRLVQASDEEVNEVGNLVVALDHFPLALEQAGAYIEETGCSFRHYLQLYHTHRSALLARRGAQTTNYPDSVATVWSLSFEEIKHANPAAIQLLQLCAFLAPDHIPEELLREGAAYWPSLLQQAVANPLAFDQMLETLLRFSLIKRLAEDQQLSIHRLVQVVQVAMIAPEEQRQWAERMVRAVNDLFPRQPQEEVRSWSQCLRYLEQVQACATLIEQHRLQFAEAADLLDRSGTYLRVHASYSLAEALYQQALRLYEELLGTQHPHIATTLNNLGRLFLELGKFKQAESYFHRALCICEEQLGAHHLHTARSLHNLGLLYWQQGKYEQAESYYQRALAIKEEQLGAHHPETALTLHNLGALYSEQGKYEQVESYYHRALAIKEEQLGAYHPETALTLSNLGSFYGTQGKYEQAKPYYHRALAIYEEQLGAHHPHTARPLCNLGFLYSEQGKYEQAEPYYQRALAIQEEQLGVHHPETALTLNNLGVLYSEQGKYEQVESYYQRALAIYEEQLGAHHPDTAETLNNLAAFYRDQHQYKQAEPLFVRALAIQEHTLAANHPDLAKTLHNFARFHERLNAPQTAAALYQRALTIRENVYGPHHPKTSETRERLQAMLLLMDKDAKNVQHNRKCLK